MGKEHSKEDVILDPPKTIAEITAGDFTYELDDDGELRISNRYEPTVFVLSGFDLKMLRIFLTENE